MDDRTTHTLTDAALDRAIGQALAVDPSPAFTARVRTRIAIEPEPGAWRFPFAGYLVAGAAVAALLTAVVLLRPDRPIAPAISAPLAARAIDNQTATLPIGRSSMSWSTSIASRPAKAFALQRGAFAPRQEADAVQVDATPIFDLRESRALRALILAVRNGRADLSPALAAPVVEGPEPRPIADIDIQPLSIEPIAPIDGAQGARQ